MGVQDLSDDELMFQLQQARTAPKAAPDVRRLVVDAANRHGIPPELALAVAKQESAFRTDALSPKGALGPMQLMPGTARDLGVDPRDPAQNVDGGVRYLKQQLDRFGDPKLALAAYNAGPGAVQKYGGVPPYAETQDYVARIAGGGPQGQTDLSQLSDDALLNQLQVAGYRRPEASPEFQQGRDLGRQIAAGAAPAQNDLAYDEGLRDDDLAELILKNGLYVPNEGEEYVTLGRGKYPAELVAMIANRNAPRSGVSIEYDDPAFPEGTLQRVVDEELARRKAVLDPWRDMQADNSDGYNRLDAFLGGAMDTLSLGFSDEISGATRAAMGMGTVRDMTEVQRMMDAKLAEEFGMTRLGGQVVGGLSLPGARFLGAAKSLPGAMGRGAALGAGYGAAYGAGSAEGGLEERLAGGGSGAVVGGALGAGFPVAARAVGRAVAPTVQSLASLSDRVRMPALRLPDSVPRRMAPEDLRVADVLSRSIGRDGVTLESVLAGQAAPGLPFERAGENLVGLAEIAAQAPGRARSLATEALTGRTAAAGDRTQEAIGQALGGKGDYLATLDANMAARKAAADQGIREIGDHLVKLDENSIIALRSDLAASSIEDAARNALASADPEVRNAGAALRGLREKLLDSPNGTTIRVRDAQDISRALNESATAAYRSGDGGRGKALSDLAKAIRGNAADPERGGFKEYADWLARYGDDSDNIAALEAGRDIFSPRLERSAEALRRQFASLSDTGKDNFRKGVGEALIAQVRSRKGGVGAMRDLLRSKEFADRVRIAFPDDQSFAGFMDFARREVDMQARANQILSNSATARRQLAAKDVEAPMTATDFILDNATLDVGALTGRTLKEALKKVPRKDRGVLTNPEMNLRLGEALFGDGEVIAKLLRDLEQQRLLQAAIQRQGAVGAGAAARGGTSVLIDQRQSAR